MGKRSGCICGATPRVLRPRPHRLAGDTSRHGENAGNPWPRQRVWTRRKRDVAMARQTFWEGYLKLSLVTCPVAMMPAISESDKIRFHILNRATGNRVESHYVDAESGRT